jgi:hypothetical protein
LLQPQTFFTVETLIDALLEKDEETREVVETRQRKLELIAKLRQLDPDDTLAVAEFVGANDGEMDEPFFQLLDVLINVAESQGDTAEHDRLAKHRALLLEKSTTGRLITAQNTAVEMLMAAPTRDTLVEQLIAAEEKSVREALVAVGRQLLDYAFFQTLTARIDAAEASGDVTAKEKLVDLRREVQEIRDQVDAMTAAVFEARSVFLRELMMAETPHDMLMRRIAEVDNVFFTVLAANIRQAESNRQQDVAQRLRQIGDVAMQILDEVAPPEYKLLNSLISAENDEQVSQTLEAERELLDQDFLELVERAIEGAQGSARSAGIERLRFAAQRIKEILSQTE